MRSDERMQSLQGALYRASQASQFSSLDSTPEEGKECDEDVTSEEKEYGGWPRAFESSESLSPPESSLFRAGWNSQSSAEGDTQEHDDGADWEGRRSESSSQRSVTMVELTSVLELREDIYQKEHSGKIISP